MPHCILSVFFISVRESTYILYYGLVYFANPLSHIGHINCTLQFIYYNTTYNTWTSTQYNEINIMKFKGQLEVESITVSGYVYLYKY